VDTAAAAAKTTPTPSASVSTSAIDVDVERAHQRVRIGGWAIWSAAGVAQLQAHKHAIESTLLLSDGLKASKLSSFDFFLDQGGLHFASDAGCALLDRIWPGIERLSVDELRDADAAVNVMQASRAEVAANVTFANTLFRPPLPKTVVVIFIETVTSKLLRVRANEARNNVKRAESKSKNVALIPDLKGTNNARRKDSAAKAGKKKAVASIAAPTPAAAKAGNKAKPATNSTTPAAKAGKKQTATSITPSTTGPGSVQGSVPRDVVTAVDDANVSPLAPLMPLTTLR
jgi:hypothetical protein